MRNKSGLNYSLSIAVLVWLVFASASLAVTSKITRHSSAVDLLKGSTEDVVVGSKGTIQLGLAAEVLVEEFADSWSINSIVVSGASIYVGTSPNGGVYEFSMGKLTKIYSAQTNKDQDPNLPGEPNDANEPNKPADTNVVEQEKYLANEHIFAMASDVAGRLLVGISGEKCCLSRLEAEKMETVFEPNDAKYIFAIAVGDDGDIYLGTGPAGKVYRLDSFGKNPQMVYDSLDKNILSLTVGADGFVYAGSDSRGLVYKINPHTKTATVLYDSEQEEITALLFAKDGDLYAAATSAKITAAETKFAAKVPLAGRPETKAKDGTISSGSQQGGLKLNIANTKDADTVSKDQVISHKGPKPQKNSYIYKITKQGFVTDIFSEMAVFFCLSRQNENLFVGTGNSGQLFSIDPESEQEKIVYEAPQASQITSVVSTDTDVYIGTANPARLIKLGSRFSSEGTYSSALIDAEQPASWGKLQIEADIPPACKVMASSRSGNVKDINDPTFSDWTAPVEITAPVQLRCPAGRFCQYKLILQSQNGVDSPLIREIAVAGTVPNLAPKVDSVTAVRIVKAGQVGVFKIEYEATDDNKDKLIYKIDFRKIGRTNWIELEDEIQAGNFEWDGKTVEDGRYELRVTASDEKSNTSETSLAGSRISEPIVVDNTGPAIEKDSIGKDGKTATLQLEARDKLSAIGELYYTVDSNADWIGAVPEDLVYDTTYENFRIVVEDLGSGEHIIAIKVADDVGNITYKTFELTIAED